jgi:hypothetical protein
MKIMFTNPSFLIRFCLFWMLCGASCQNEASDARKSVNNTSRTSVTQSFNAEEDCAWLSKWFSEECSDSLTRFACNGTEPLIQEMAADHDWCSGTGYLKVKTLFRKGFYENGQEKMMILVGMEPQARQKDPTLKECILGGSVWANDGTNWIPIVKTNMFVFLQSNLHEPMKIQMTDNETIRLEYLDVKKPKVMTIRVEKNGFGEPTLEDL